MSELKEVYAYQSDEIESLVGSANGNSYYLKSEADEAIAELKAENRKLKRALWLTRAAMCRTYDSCAYFIEKPDSKRRFTDFFVLMQKAAATAAIKAEEYK